MLMRATPTQTERSRQEYDVLFQKFLKLMDVFENGAERWDVMEDIITLRASFLIDRAIAGLRIDFDHALYIIRQYNNFTTERERYERDVLVAAIENLADFAAAEECQMLRDMEEAGTDDLEICEDIFKRYNLTWADVENEEVSYAAGIAYWWLGISFDTLLTFMTQGDERVRPWHLDLEGLSYRKSEFPPELIPPIEWGCRCYLLADGMSMVRASLRTEQAIRNVNPVFRESLATGGRIFSDGHRYFDTPLPFQVRTIVSRIKQKFYGDDQAIPR